MAMSPADREALLSTWVKPSSDTEKDQQDRAERMVRDAIKGWPAFDGVDYEIYTKGSYPNNTNVKADSDVEPPRCVGRLDLLRRWSHDLSRPALPAGAS